jgi:hypothetical protein
MLALLISLFVALTPPTAHAQTLLPIVLVRIAECESGFKQFYDDGSIVQSKTHDFGMFQINHIHFKEALSMGYDPMTAEGNISYALYLFSKNGTKDWSMSKSCWSSRGP